VQSREAIDIGRQLLFWIRAGAARDSSVKRVVTMIAISASLRCALRASLARNLQRVGIHERDVRDEDR
jgi:hypothetical protein